MRYIWLFLWLLLGLLYFLTWSCNKKQCCDDLTAIAGSEEAADPLASVDLASTLILFQKDRDSAIIGDRWAAYVDSLMNLVTDGKLVTVTGYYHPNEVNNSSYPNLGLARAAAIKKALMAAGIPSDKIVTKGVMRSGDLDGGVHICHAIDCDEYKAPDRVVQLEDHARIHFAYNSDEWIKDPALLTYLDKVVEEIKDGTETIALTGHTDGTGDSAYNLELGRERAQAIKDHLMQKGLSGDRISVNSMGETQPIAGNDTEAGRALNRRVELKIQS